MRIGLACCLVLAKIMINSRCENPVAIPSVSRSENDPPGGVFSHIPLVNIQKTMENHHFQWVNPLFLWPFSIAMLVYQRVSHIETCWVPHATELRFIFGATSALIRCWSGSNLAQSITGTTQGSYGILQQLPCHVFYRFLHWGNYQKANQVFD